MLKKVEYATGIPFLFCEFRYRNWYDTSNQYQSLRADSFGYRNQNRKVLFGSVVYGTGYSIIPAGREGTGILGNFGIK